MFSFFFLFLAADRFFSTQIPDIYHVKKRRQLEISPRVHYFNVWVSKLGFPAPAGSLDCIEDSSGCTAGSSGYIAGLLGCTADSSDYTEDSSASMTAK